jgi:PBP1b-binding outer membrane lipoprotein LpoB
VRGVLIASHAMRITAPILLAMTSAALLWTGCVSTVDGRREYGNPLIKDKIVRVYERPVLQCWAAAKDVLGANGVIFSEDVMQSTVSARVDTKTVRVKCEPIEDKMTRITTQVRTKACNSDIDLAGEIDKQIALRLATGQLPATGSPVSR